MKSPLNESIQVDHNDTPLIDNIRSIVSALIDGFSTEQ